MKVAYLMNGLIGGLSGKNYEQLDLDVRSEIIKFTSNTHDKLRQDTIDIDYFIFSWEPELLDTYIDCYQPKRIECIPQFNFDMPDHYVQHTSNSRIQAHYSRWYGAKKVMQLLIDYIESTNTTYDLVINARLDLCYQNCIDLTSFDSQKFHIAYPVNLPRYNWPYSTEIIDHFFASSIDNMILFSSLFDLLDDYTRPDQCPRYRLISNHFLSVWHLRKINLLHENIIKKSITTYDDAYDSTTDYYIFRYKKLTLNEVLKTNKSLL